MEQVKQERKRKTLFYFSRMMFWEHKYGNVEKPSSKVSLKLYYLSFLTCRINPSSENCLTSIKLKKKRKKNFTTFWINYTSINLFKKLGSFSLVRERRWIFSLPLRRSAEESGSLLWVAWVTWSWVAKARSAISRVLDSVKQITEIKGVPSLFNVCLWHFQSELVSYAYLNIWHRYHSWYSSQVYSSPTCCKVFG